MLILTTLFIGLFLAFSNGGNDNFKGVATLYGSGISTYRASLRWATIGQICGSLAAVLLAQELLATFSGKGLVPDSVLQLQNFTLSVGLAAATTVMLATRFGFPVSTTHALTGALMGVGYLASPVGVNWAKLRESFFMPLLLSPFIAVFLSVIIYLGLKSLRIRLKIQKETCVCVGTEIVSTLSPHLTPEQALAQQIAVTSTSLRMDAEAHCREVYQGEYWGVNLNRFMDRLHFSSSAVVCFTRALNDTPKIASILLVGTSYVAAPVLFFFTALAMALGGMIQSRRIAETLSHKVTDMNSGQGFSANLVTAFLVTTASKLGIPVSTTHVSCGSLFGIGAVTGQGHWKMILQIFIAWVTTLPVAVFLGYLFFSMLQFFHH